MKKYIIIDNNKVTGELIAGNYYAPETDNFIEVSNDFTFEERLGDYIYNGVDFELIPNFPEIKLLREKEAKLLEIKQAFNTAANRPRVDSTLGYDVNGNKDDLYNFENALVLGVTEIRDADNIMQPATNADLELIIQKIRENGLVLYQKKWDLVATVEAATELADLSEITW